MDIPANQAVRTLMSGSRAHQPHAGTRLDLHSAFTRAWTPLPKASAHTASLEREDPSATAHHMHVP